LIVNRTWTRCRSLGVSEILSCTGTLCVYS